MIAETRRVPKLPHWPLVGNLFALRRDPLRLLERVYRECGEAGVFHVGTRPVYVLTAPEYAAEVLQHQAALFRRGPMVRDFARPLFGAGLITAEPEAHARRRAMLTPLFHARRLADAAGLALEEAVATEEKWRHATCIDATAETRRLVLSLVGRFVFGNMTRDEAAALGQALDEGVRYVSRRLANPLSPPLSWPTPYNRRVSRAVAKADQNVRALIAARRAQPAAGEDLLGELLAAQGPEGRRLSDDEARDDLVFLFLAAFEPMASVLAWTLCLVAEAPAVFTRLRAELDEVVGDRPPTVEDGPRLVYATQVLKEALRLFPPVHTLGRQAIEDVTVRGFRLRAGALVLVCPYLLHRRSDVFPDPLRFDPDRFSGRSSYPRFAYLPFGAGSRACLGSSLSLVQGPLLLAALVRRCRLELAGPPPCAETLMSLRPKNARLWVRRE